MWRASALLVLAMALAACGVPETEQGGDSDEPDPTPAISDPTRLEAACATVMEGLTERNTGEIVSSLEDLDAILSNDGLEDLRRSVIAATDAMPVFGDTPASDAELAEAAPDLIDLSNELVAAGARECGVIGEVAAEFDTRSVDRESVSELLQAARTRWVEADVSTYSLVLSAGPMEPMGESCGTGGSTLVQVVNGSVELAVDRMIGCHIDPDDSDRVPLTVEEMFTFVEDNVDVGSVEVDFDPDLGYPRLVFVQDGSVIVEFGVLSLTPGEADLQSAKSVLEELQQQRMKWADTGIADYTHVVEIGCFCPEDVRGPFEVTVVGGEVATVIFDGQSIEPVNDDLLTVGGLFSTIEENAYSDEISVTYSPEGYPTTIDIDPAHHVFDEELRIDVHDLEAGRS